MWVVLVSVLVASVCWIGTNTMQIPGLFGSLWIRFHNWIPIVVGNEGGVDVNLQCVPEWGPELEGFRP